MARSAADTCPLCHSPMDPTASYCPLCRSPRPGTAGEGSSRAGFVVIAVIIAGGIVASLLKVFGDF